MRRESDVMQPPPKEEPKFPHNSLPISDEAITAIMDLIRGKFAATAKPSFKWEKLSKEIIATGLLSTLDESNVQQLLTMKPFSAEVCNLLDKLLLIADLFFYIYSFIL